MTDTDRAAGIARDAHRLADDTARFCDTTEEGDDDGT